MTDATDTLVNVAVPLLAIGMMSHMIGNHSRSRSAPRRRKRTQKRRAFY